jgi:hypothetical protein
MWAEQMPFKVTSDSNLLLTRRSDPRTLVDSLDRRLSLARGLVAKEYTLVSAYTAGVWAAVGLLIGHGESG